MNEMIENAGKQMIITARVLNTYARRGDKCLLTRARFTGMYKMLEALGIECVFEQGTEFSGEIKSITIMGKRFEV